jgi:XTP/dITP diphosphohydrolase
MAGVQNRNAMFRTVISLIINSGEYFFEGRVRGRILHECKGSEGFGYDPIFQPDGYDLSFAEMDAKQKNRISHRAEAVEKMISFLKSL